MAKREILFPYVKDGSLVHYTREPIGINTNNVIWAPAAIFTDELAFVRCDYNDSVCFQNHGGHQYYMFHTEFNKLMRNQYTSVSLVTTTFFSGSWVNPPQGEPTRWIGSWKPMKRGRIHGIVPAD